MMKWLFGKMETPKEPENEKPLCASRNDCLFVKRHGNCPEFRIKRYHSIYCNGYLLEKCARLLYYNEKQCEAPEHMAPTGLIIESHRADKH